MRRNGHANNSNKQQKIEIRVTIVLNQYNYKPNTVDQYCLVENLLGGRSSVKRLIRSTMVVIMPEPS